MKGSACDRWMALTDRVAVGERLSDADARFERQHRAQCEVCRAESRVWDQLGRCLDDDSESPRALELETALAPPRGAWRWWAFGSIGAGAVAAAAAVALYVAVPRVVVVTEPGEPPSPAGGDTQVNLVLVSGQVEVRGAQAAAGATLRPSDTVRVGEGRACLAYSPRTFTCGAEGTKLRVVAANESERRLRLDAGSVVCRLDEPTRDVQFSVETPRGRVTAKGTVFAVEQLENTEIVIRLHRGVVEVETPSGVRRELRAPAGLVLGEGMRPTATTGDAWHQDAALIEVADLWGAGAVAPVDIDVQPRGARMTLDGVELGQSPVSTLVGRGEHELVATQEGFVSHRERFIVQGAERISRNPVLEDSAPEVSSSNPSSARAPNPTPVPTAAELLKRARQLRGSGQYVRAANEYQGLIKRYPGSAEARVAHLSIGELQLSQLGNPAAALGAFDTYLARGGSLTQEARYGRIRALRQLGRGAEAERAVDDFVRDYPGSAQARLLREQRKER